MYTLNHGRSRPLSLLLLLGISIFFGGATGCATETPAKPRVETRSVPNERLLIELEQIAQAFEAAHAENDAIAMTQAALDRIELAKTWFDEVGSARFIENSVAMIHSARLIAAQDQDTYETFLAMLDDADLAFEKESASGFGRLFGNTKNPMQRARVSTHEIKGRGKSVVKLRVSDDIGVIVYLEAPAFQGVELQLSDDQGVVRCTDASTHGDLICRFRPTQPGLVTASIYNPSANEVTVLMVTNHPVDVVSLGQR